MSNLDLKSPNNNANWKILAEYLIPTTHGKEAQVLDHIASMMSQFDLEPRQMGRIMSAIDQSLQDLEDGLAPLRLRISVSGLDWDEKLTEDSLARQQDPERAGGGLGFFLVKRIVGQLQDPNPAKYRLVEVLLYRESGQGED